MIKSIISPAARQDLQDIGDYIAFNNPAAAVSFIARLEKRCADLAQHPGIGRKRNELQPGLRSLAEGRYLIFFRSKTNNILEIVRIIHGNRKFDALFEIDEVFEKIFKSYK